MDYVIALVKASSLHALLALVASAFVFPAHAQDTVKLKSGVVREGKITGVSGGVVRVQTAAGSTGTPLAEVVEVTMTAPPEFDAAAAQLGKGDAKGALAALQKINDAYAGLPAAWMERAAAMLGDAKLAAGDTAGAKQAYDNFVKAYPKATALANLGRARLAVDAGQFAEAEKLLTPLLASSAKTAFPLPDEAPALSQSHYLMGRVKEAAGQNQEALAHYLKASAVFPFDANAAAAAQKRADQLRKDNPGLIAP